MRQTSNECRAERVAKGMDLHAAHSCTWLLLDRRTGPKRARCQMVEAICSGVYLLPGAWKENPFLPVRGRREARAEGKRPEDYIRFPRKRNIERNLIMSVGCAHVARFRSVCGEDFYSSSRRKVRKIVEGERCNSVMRLRVGRREIIFPWFLTSGTSRSELRGSFVAAANHKKSCEMLSEEICAKMHSIARKWIKVPLRTRLVKLNYKLNTLS